MQLTSYSNGCEMDKWFQDSNCIGTNCCHFRTVDGCLAAMSIIIGNRLFFTLFLENVDKVYHIFFPWIKSVFVNFLAHLANVVLGCHRISE